MIEIFAISMCLYYADPKSNTCSIVSQSTGRTILFHSAAECEETRQKGPRYRDSNKGEVSVKYTCVHKPVPVWQPN
jgi:hypothetical protein